MRCAGSTDSHRVRIRTYPSEGRGIGASFQRKNSSPVNLPAGRAFKIHWRFLLSVMGCPRIRGEFRMDTSATRQTHEPSGDGLANLMRRIFLKKMVTADRDLFLIAPGAAELEQAAGEDGAWIAADKQFRNVVRRHPVAVVFDDLRRMLRYAIDRDLARKLKRWPAVFTGLQIRPAIDRHFSFGKRRKIGAG